MAYLHGVRAGNPELDTISRPLVKEWVGFRGKHDSSVLWAPAFAGTRCVLYHYIVLAKARTHSTPEHCCT